MTHDGVSGQAQLAVASLARGKIDDHRSRLHALDGVLADEQRCRPSRNERGGDDDVGRFGALGDERLLSLLVVLAHLACVAAGGYAREMSEDNKKRQQALIAERAKAADIVITTALIPGRPAPL